MIGVFDSGSGGLTILEGLRAALPAEDFLYLGDHANAPYGHRSNRQIVDMTKAGCDLLMRQGCSLVVLACNTAAAVALRTLQQTWLDQAWPGRRILGVLVPTVEALTGKPWQGYARPHRPLPPATGSAVPGDAEPKSVLLFATQKTVDSGAYRDELRKRAPHITLTEKACPGLVDALEGGAGPRPLEGLVEGYVAEAMAEADGDVDHVLLGCTHFPLAMTAFRKALPAQTSIVSQPALVAASLADYVSRHERFRTTGNAGQSGTLACLTTADPASMTAATSRDILSRCGFGGITWQACRPRA